MDTLWVCETGLREMALTQSVLSPKSVPRPLGIIIERYSSAVSTRGTLVMKPTLALPLYSALKAPSLLPRRVVISTTPALARVP